VHRAEEPRAKYGPLIASSIAVPGTFGTAPVAPSVDTSGAKAANLEPTEAATSPRPAPAPGYVEPKEPRTVEPVRSLVRSRRTPMPVHRARPGAGQLEPTESPASIKQRYPRAYQRWTPEEDALLTRLYKQGKDLPTMCAALGRQLKSVETRIRRIEVDIDEADFPDDGSGEFPPEPGTPSPKAAPAAEAPVEVAPSEVEAAESEASADEDERELGAR
jgi:hypothetical protein